MILEHVPDSERLVVMLGSSIDFRVGYDAAALSELDIDSQNQFDSFQSYFQAREPDSCGEIVLQNHTVKVKINNLVFRASKYYMVDVEMVAKIKEPGLLDILGDLVLGEEVASGQDKKEVGNRIAKAKKTIWGRISTRTRG